MEAVYEDGDHKRILGGVAAIVFDHIRRGFEFATKMRLLKRDTGRSSVWVLHEIGACLQLKDWLEQRRPGFEHASVLDVARLNVSLVLLKGELYSPDWRRPGPLSRRVLAYRFRREVWWDLSEYIRGEPLCRSESIVQLHGNALDALARLLWVNRHVGRN